MANLEWALCCDYAFHDRDNKACMIGLFDRIWADEFPATHLVFFVVSQWTGGESEETFNQRTRILAPDGIQIAETLGAEITTSPGGGAGVVSRFVGATFPQAGTYRVELLADDNVVGSIVLTVAMRG